MKHWLSRASWSYPQRQWVWGWSRTLGPVGSCMLVSPAACMVGRFPAGLVSSIRDCSIIPYTARVVCSQALRTEDRTQSFRLLITEEASITDNMSLCWSRHGTGQNHRSDWGLTMPCLEVILRIQNQCVENISYNHTFLKLCLQKLIWSGNECVLNLKWRILQSKYKLRTIKCTLMTLHFSMNKKKIYIFTKRSHSLNLMKKFLVAKNKLKCQKKQKHVVFMYWINKKTWRYSTYSPCKCYTVL